MYVSQVGPFMYLRLDHIRIPVMYLSQLNKLIVMIYSGGTGRQKYGVIRGNFQRYGNRSAWERGRGRGVKIKSVL